MRCGVGHRQGLDPALLWLWHKPAAIVPIRPLAWEPPYATDVALKRQKKKKKKFILNCSNLKGRLSVLWDCGSGELLRKAHNNNVLATLDSFSKV